MSSCYGTLADNAELVQTDVTVVSRFHGNLTDLIDRVHSVNNMYADRQICGYFSVFSDLNPQQNTPAIRLASHTFHPGL
jgi:hypothetical protein